MPGKRCGSMRYIKALNAYSSRRRARKRCFLFSAVRKGRSRRMKRRLMQLVKKEPSEMPWPKSSGAARAHCARRPVPFRDAPVRPVPARPGTVRRRCPARKAYSEMITALANLPFRTVRQRRRIYGPMRTRRRMSALCRTLFAGGRRERCRAGLAGGPGPEQPLRRENSWDGNNAAPQRWRLKHPIRLLLRLWKKNSGAIRSFCGRGV